MSLSLNWKLWQALGDCKSGSPEERKLKQLIAADYDREIAKQNYRIWRNAITANYGHRTKVKPKPYTLKHDPSGFWSLTQIPLKNKSVKSTPPSALSPLSSPLGLAVSLSRKNSRYD